MEPRRPVRARQVEEISAMTEAVLRNLWITQAYHDFASGLAAIGGQTNATWCAFAVWASKTAGAVIRGDELPARMRELLKQSEDVSVQLTGVNEHRRHLRRHGVLAELTHSHLMEVFDRVMEDVSAQIAAGNVLVFQELGPIFAGLVDAFESGPRPAVEDFDRVVGPYLAGRDPGEDSVAIAFSQYWRALFEKDDATQAALILAANINSVAHEQQRLQPAIAGALNAAIDDSLREVAERDVNRLLPLTAIWRHMDRAVDDLCTALGRLWQTAATETMMRLATADEVLVLHHDLPAPVGRALFPADLIDVGNPELAAALRQWDRTGGTGRKTAVRDWAAIEERMNYIVNFFRSRQQHPSILTAPFTDAQLLVLASGQMPPGPL